MERFFILDQYNTWYDWGLILTAKSVTPPTPKTNYVKLDGMSGSLDLSDALTGEITYEDRTVSASFWTDEGTYEDREKIIREITNKFHGKKIKITEPDDPDRHFIGRVTVKSPKNNLSYAEISIECACEPWRYANTETVRRIEVDGAEAIEAILYNGGTRTVSPTITVSGTVTVSGHELTTGTYRVSDLRLYSGVNVIAVSGHGTITLEYKEADL